MTNQHRKIFYCFFIFIILILFIATILTAIFVTNKTVAIVLAVFTFYGINATLALWISTSNVRIIHTKLAWVLSFIVFPFISHFIYFVWGRMPYHKKGLDSYKNQYKKYIDLYDHSIEADTANEDTFDLLAKYVHTTRQSDVFYNNSINVIIDNMDLLKNMLELIERAQKIILINYYIIDDGLFFQAIKNKLIDKAKTGVQVYILYDRYGSTNKFTPKMVAKLAIHPNIHVAKFESDRDVWTRSANNFRSHKKMLVIDNTHVLYGGSNLADEYLSIKRGYSNWNDLNFIVQGPIVKSFIIDYCIDWDFSSFLPYIFQMGDYKKVIKVLKPFLWLKFICLSSKNKKLYKLANDTRVHHKNLLDVIKNMHFLDKSPNNIYNKENKAVFFQTGPRYYNNIVTDVLITAILNAKKSVKIISPFLQLTDSVISALVSASHRNIDIHVVLPGSADDKWFLDEMNSLNYEQLLEANINLYEYFGFIHSKLVIIDDRYILTGTFNLDIRSFNTNYESILIIKNPNTIEQLKQYWINVVSNSDNITSYKLFIRRGIKSILIQTGLQIIQPLL